MTEDVARWWLEPVRPPPWLPWVVLVLGLTVVALVARALCGS